MKPEARSPKVGIGAGLRSRLAGMVADSFRISVSGLHSDFGFRAICLAAAMFICSPAAFAQSNGVPGANDYASFSRFITDRNIFDPNRVPHNYTQRTNYRSRYRTRSTGTPGIQLVGTMVYEKGPFAFFNASSSEYRKALGVGGKIAGYTITAITADSVGLESTDMKNMIELKVGDGLVQQGNKWTLAKAGVLPVVVSPVTQSASSPSSSSSDAAGNSAEPDAPAAPPSESAPNDVLKRLMEQREKETK